MPTAGVVAPLVALTLAVAVAWATGGLRLPARLTCSAVAVAGAVTALWARPAPSGHPAEDAVLRAAVIVLLAGAGSIAAPWVGIVAGAVALAATGTGSGALFAAAGLGLAVGGVLRRVRSPVTGAANGVLVALALMHLRWPSPARASSGLGGLVIVVMVAAGFVALGRPARRRTLGVLAIGVVVVVAASVGLGFGALRARAAGTAAVSDATSALALAQATDTPGAAARFRQAAAGFRTTRRDVTAWWARPGRYVPGLAQQAAVLVALSDGGARLAEAAATTADAANPEVFRPHAGVVDVARMEAIRPAVQASLAAVDQVSATLGRPTSVWLAPPVADQLTRLRTKLGTAAAQARTLGQVLDVVPGLLGAHGTRHYFLAVQTPAEMRAGGGIIGNYGELTAENGRIRLTRFGRIGELNPTQDRLRRIIRPADYLERYLRFGADLYFQNATLSPDFPSVASVIEQLYPQSGGEPIDGVVSVDPIALAALLRLTGPVTVDGWPTPIPADNVEQVLLHDQYAEIQNGTTRVDFLAGTTRQVVDRLSGSTLPGPSSLIAALGPAVRGKHLELHSIRPAEQALFAHMGATGALPPVNDDFFAMVGQNGSESKIDWYLRRSVAYHATVDPATGAERTVADITITNDAPSTGEPPYIIGGADPQIPARAGDNRMYLSFYSPLALEGASVDGKPALMESELEGGRFVYSLLTTVASRTTVHLQLRLAGHVDPGGLYRLDVSSQPTIHPDYFVADVVPTAGWQLMGRPPPAAPLVGNGVVLDLQPAAGLVIPFPPGLSPPEVTICADRAAGDGLSSPH